MHGVRATDKRAASADQSGHAQAFFVACQQCGKVLLSPRPWREALAPARKAGSPIYPPTHPRSAYHISCCLHISSAMHAGLAIFTRNDVLF